MQIKLGNETVVIAEDRSAYVYAGVLALIVVGLIASVFFLV